MSIHACVFIIHQSFLGKIALANKPHLAKKLSFPENTGCLPRLHYGSSTTRELVKDWYVIMST